MSPSGAPPKTGRLRELLRPARYFFRPAWLFSLGINALLLVSPLYMLQVFDRVLTSRSSETLLVLTLGAILALMVMAALETIRSRLFVNASAGVDALLSRTVFDQVVLRSASAGAEPAGHLRDVQQLRQFLTGNAMIGFFDLPWLPLFLLVIWFMHPLLAAVACVGVLALVGLAIWDERATRDRLLAANRKHGEAVRYADQVLRNGEIVNALGMHHAAARRWRLRGDEALELQGEASERAGTVSALTKFLRVLLQVIMLGTGAYLVLEQHLSSGLMMAATILLSKVTAPAELVIANWRQFIEARAAWGRLDQLLSASGQEKDQVSLPEPTGALLVEKVTLVLAPDQPPILKDVSFSLSAGESLGVIGPSAAGKSSLARVLLGVWPLASGVVRLDGADMAQWPKADLGPHLGYLPQDIELFSGTVGQNIARLGEAEADSEAIIAAAQMAGAHEMILKLPKGYDTEIGVGGAVLSGGQRQRIGLARALFGSPKLVVLDEPNAHLDRDGEQALVDAINKLKANRVTTIVITHKPALLAGADKLLFLRSGEVAAFGPRQEVLARLMQAAGGEPVSVLQPSAEGGR